MTPLRKTGQGGMVSCLRLICMGTLMLLSGTRPLAMPLPLKLAATFGEYYNSSFYNEVYRKMYVDNFSTDGLYKMYMNKGYAGNDALADRMLLPLTSEQMRIEKLIYSAYYQQTSIIGKRECIQRLQRFYKITLECSFQAKDTAAAFYCMEQIKLIKPGLHLWEDEQHHPITISALQQQLLVHNLQYLNYVETDSGIYALLVSSKTIICKKIEFAGYRDTLKAFMKICADKLMLNRCYNRYAQTANLLYKKLFVPMHILPGRLLIAQEETFLPFEALTIDSEGNDFLLYHNSISYAYAATWYFRSQQKPAVAGNGFLGIAPEYFSPGAAQTRLYGAVESLAKIEDYFSVHNMLTWNTASEKTFLESAGKYSILHIYTHAAQHNGRKVLYMYDKPVDINDLALPKSLSLQLVFLAACETAVAGDDESETGYSLADHFINAGVPSTVATLWRTETQTMYAISELFYQFLEQGLSKDEALQQAKMQFIKKDIKPNQLPYYWACVVLLGNADALMPPTQNTASFCLTALINISVCAVWRMLERRAG